MGMFIGSLTNAASITLTDLIITHSFCIHTMPLTHTNINSTAVTNVAHSKIFSISCCNIRGQSSNLNSVHQYLQSSNPHALFLTKTKIKPLDANDNSILCPRLKWPGYRLSPLSSQMVVFVHMFALMFKALVYFNLTLLILVFNSSG